MSLPERCELIEDYFHLGLHYCEILEFLAKYHNIFLSLRQLHRILRSRGLKRANSCSPLADIVRALELEMKKTGESVGYRMMHNRLTQLHSLNVGKEVVRLLLKQLDPNGVEHRKCRRLKRRNYLSCGPNYIWHIDGWDKLKPFGLTVHGCIDGYSRRIIWLKGSTTNNDPFVVCGHFVESCTEINGLPQIIRSDRGTENVNIESLQRVLRSFNDDVRGQTQTAFLYGKSTHNQRIESWWSKFKCLGMDIWIKHFKSLVHIGILDTSLTAHTQCVRFCYMALFCRTLNEIKCLWNIHHIRKSRNDSTKSGKPDVLYFLPTLCGSQDRKIPFSSEDMSILAEELVHQPPAACAEPYKELF